MARQNYDYRFELKPGRWVYIQTGSARATGRSVIRAVRKRYVPSDLYYHIGKEAGHVAALRQHLGSTLFSRYDIENFFGQVTRTKVVRALRQIGFTRANAFNLAYDSVVVEGSVKVLPYGFCQSPLLATLVLERSHLGRVLETLSQSGLIVTVYMDDIIVSGHDQSTLQAASNSILEAAKQANLNLQRSKTAVAKPKVTAFNCTLSHQKVELVEPRLDQFVLDYRSTSDRGKAAIEKYIDAISANELASFKQLLG